MVECSFYIHVLHATRPAMQVEGPSEREARILAELRPFRIALEARA